MSTEDTMTDTAVSSRKSSPRRPAVRRRSAVLLIVVALVLVYAVGGRSHQLVTQAIVTGILLGGVYGLVSMGLTLIFGVLGIVNFAQGTLLTLAMYVAYVLVSSAGLDVYVSTLIT